MMNDLWREFRTFVGEHKEWMLLPVLILILLLTLVIVFNRDSIQTPFVYSSF